MPARFDHLTLVAADLGVSANFFDAVLRAAGWDRVVAYQDFEDEGEVGEEAIGYGPGSTVAIWLVAGRPATTGAHVAVRVDDPRSVDAVAAVVGVPPRHRPRQGRPGYYGVDVRDPDGNTVEVFAADPGD